MSDNSQIKSKKRVVDHGEVFTPEHVVNAMLDFVKQETVRIDSRFLEPACGTGNFLIEILRRKMEVVEERYSNNQLEYERNSIIAIGSMYGVELLEDNVIYCRERLKAFFDENYTRLFKSDCREECRQSFDYVLKKNVIWGNTLALIRADGSKKPIVFSEWSPVNGSMIKRRDYSFADLLNYQPMKGPNLFSDLGHETFIPKPVAEYPLTHYLRLSDHD